MRIKQEQKALADAIINLLSRHFTRRTFTKKDALKLYELAAQYNCKSDIQYQDNLCIRLRKSKALNCWSVAWVCRLYRERISPQNTVWKIASSTVIGGVLSVKPTVALALARDMEERWKSGEEIPETMLAEPHNFLDYVYQDGRVESVKVRSRRAGFLTKFTQTSVNNLYQDNENLGRIFVKSDIDHLQIERRRRRSCVAISYRYRCQCTDGKLDIKLGDAAVISLAKARDLCRIITAKIFMPNCNKSTNVLRPAIAHFLRQDLAEIMRPAMELPRQTQDKIFVRNIPECSAITAAFGNLPAELKAQNRSKVPSLNDAIEQWFKIWSQERQLDHTKKVYRVLHKYLEPVLGVPVNAFDHPTTFAVLERVYAASPSRCRFLMLYLRNALVYARNRGWIHEVPNFTYMCKTFKKKSKTQHQQTLSGRNLRSELKILFGTVVMRMPFLIRAYVELLFFTLLRPGELLRLKWDDVYIDHPDDCGNFFLHVGQTKIGNSFDVPLTPYARDILQKIRRSSRSEYVFSGHFDPKTHIGYSTIAGWMKKLCGFFTLHGSRAAGATWMAMHMDDFPYEVAMTFLNHRYTSKVHKAYERTDMLYEIRGQKIKVWSDFLQQSIGSYSVLVLR